MCKHHFFVAAGKGGTASNYFQTVEKFVNFPRDQ